MICFFFLQDIVFIFIRLMNETPLTWLENFWYFGTVVANDRWSLTRGDRKGRFDCSFIQHCRKRDNFINRFYSLLNTSHRNLNFSIILLSRFALLVILTVSHGNCHPLHSSNRNAKVEPWWEDHGYWLYISKLSSIIISVNNEAKYMMEVCNRHHVCY